METTTVLSIRSLTTLPTRSFLRLRTVVIPFSVTPRRTGACPPLTPNCFLLAQNRDQARHLAPPFANLERVVELLHRIAEAQVEQLLPQLGDPLLDLVDRHVPHGVRLDVRHVTLLPARGVPRTVYGSEASTLPIALHP